jgi:tRNA pseudouridine38-40 synthase
MRNIKIIIEYDGTNYSGWQKQKNGISIQEVIENAASVVLKEKISLTGSSRTDAGVHAKGQVANFYSNSNIPSDKIPFAINSKLPHDIAVMSAQDVPHDFHSRYDSCGKLYSYTILNRKIPPVLMRNYISHCPYKLDFSLMEKASDAFVGTHDFSAFKSSGSSVKTAIRTVEFLKLEKNDDIIRFYIKANGFLYNMVRIIAGTLIDIGRGKIVLSDLSNIIESKNRNLSGKTAPASGLCLEKVFYKNE